MENVRGHYSYECTELLLKYFCGLPPNFLAFKEFSLTLLSNIFLFCSSVKINTLTTFSEFILTAYF